MNELVIYTNKFLENVLKFFELEKNEKLNCVKCTSHLNWLEEKLFICRFLYDCINKGIKYHENYLEDNKNLIAKKITNRDISKLINDFKEIMKNKEIIIILAYEFFVNYLNDIIIELLQKNTKLLKNVKEIKYKGFELINIIEKNPNLLLDDLINVFLYGNKDDENLRTNPEFWIKFLTNELKIDLTEEEKNFWESLHIRRNAHSHINSAEKWNEINSDFLSIDFNLWLYGIIFLAYNINDKISKKYGFKTENFEFRFSGEPIYDLEKISKK